MVGLLLVAGAGYMLYRAHKAQAMAPQLKQVQISPETTVEQLSGAPVGSTVNVPTGTLVEPGTVVVGSVVMRQGSPELLAYQAATEQAIQEQQARLAMIQASPAYAGETLQQQIIDSFSGATASTLERTSRQ